MIWGEILTCENRGICKPRLGRQVVRSTAKSAATRSTVLISLLVCLLASFLAPGCGTSKKGPRVEKFTETRSLMGTWATMTIITGGGKQAVRAMDAAFAAIDSVNTQMSRYIEETDISRLNRLGSAEAVSVSEATYSVVEMAVSFTKTTGGAFDVTVGPLIQLWREGAEKDALPTDADIQLAMTKVGASKLTLDPSARTIAFAADGMMVDLGGIAKGFAIDQATEALEREGVSGGIVEIGGDLRCFGEIPAALIGVQPSLPVRALRKHARTAPKTSPADSTMPLFSGIKRTEGVPVTEMMAWPLGLQSPFGEMLLGKIRLPAGSVATSGHYRRFVTIEGAAYSHIVDPRSGYPVAAPSSATVIAADAITADLMATAITVLGTEAGLRIAEEMLGVEALVIGGTPQDPVLQTTSGFPEIEPM